MGRTSDYAFAGVALLAVAAPFETTAPLIRVPGQSISDIEFALVASFLTWAVAMVAFGTWPIWRTPLTAPWLALLVASTIAALASPVSRVNALHMTGRLAAAFGIYLLTVNAVTTPARVRSVLALVFASGVLVAVLAILEFVQLPAILRVLTLFRPGVATVGSQVRAAGPLQYPTIASMYLEVAFAFGVGLLLMSHEIGRQVASWAAFIALVLVGEAIALTYTRAGVITMAVTLVLALLGRYRRHGADGGVRVVAALGILVAVLLLSSRSVESTWLRLTTEGQDTWYRASIDAPAEIAAAAGRDQIVPLAVTNTGRLVWDSQSTPPIYLSYHWIASADDRVVAFEGIRTPFERPVSPGQRAAVSARVRAPSDAGEYRISWDLVQEGHLWFTTEPGAVPQTSHVSVHGEPPQSPLPMVAPPRPTVRPGRFQLWHAALAMFLAHPVVGVGPDNFRLSYGRYAGIARPDPRVHSNNMYLEVLAGTGSLGAAMFLWLVWSARVGGTANIGVVCALVAIAIHGAVDSFLSFVPTYVLFALTLGVACAEPRNLEIASDAHRV